MVGNRTPIVVELFTSEGCSDCPPAEDFARQMEEEPLAGVDLIVLEEHVTYWNQYGWFDPFSSPDWTARQMEYVGKSKNPQPYTPEMVIDGQQQFPGANGAAAQAAVDAVVKEPQTSVVITRESVSPTGEAEFQVSVGRLAGSTPGDQAQVWLGVTEDGLYSKVYAGENSGHTLYHAAVLRYLHKIGVARDAGYSGEAKVKLNSKWKRRNLNIVAFVQDKKSLKIIGAAEIKLKS